MVAVLGAYSNGDSPSRYSLLSTTRDSTITLSSGIPRTSRVAQGRYQYFKFSVTIPHLDVVVSVTPISGDPDIYVGVGVQHPTRYNFTFAQSMIGADTLTVQYQELNRYCTPDYFSQCDLFIGAHQLLCSNFT